MAAIKALAALAAVLTVIGCAGAPALRGSGDLGLVIERADGSALIVEHTHGTRLHRIEGLGDLGHASAVYSRDARYAYVFGRDGGLSKIDMLGGTLVRRVIQGGNSIGGAISQDGRLIAVSNYEPGGVRIFTADTLEPVLDIPAHFNENKQRSKVVGLVDAPGQRFVFSLFDAGEIWLADMSDIECRNAVIDSSSFRQATGWAPQYDFDAGLKEAYHDFSRRAS